MTMRRILPFVLVLLVAVMTGCSLFGSSDSGSNSTNQNANNPNRANANSTTSTGPSAGPINWKSATQNIQNAVEKVSPDNHQPVTVKQVNDDVTKARKELGKDDQEIKEKCDKCEAETIIAAQAAHESMTGVIEMLKPLLKNPLDAQTKTKVKPLLDDAADKLEAAERSYSQNLNRNAATPTPTPTPSQTPEDAGKSYGLMDYVIYGLAIAGGLLVLVLIGTGILQLRNQLRKYFEHQLGKAAAANASVTREAQKEIVEKLSSLSSAQHDTNTRLHDVHTEIRSLARLMRDSSPGRGDGRAYSSFGSSYGHNDPQPPPKEEPDFPVSAVDYLGKMTRFANVVKPDFQNGILINDPDGTGELMLIRDSRRPDETQPLFVVPRHAQFSTKQDFYTYYEKYYDCSKPSAGDVWIIDPAVVEKVSGGWQLREKGVLEIR